MEGGGMPRSNPMEELDEASPLQTTMKDEVEEDSPPMFTADHHSLYMPMGDRIGYDWDPRAVGLYSEAMKEKWDAMKTYYQENPATIEIPLTVLNDTALHIAAHSNNTDLMQELIYIEPNLLDELNDLGNSVLYEVATNGNVDMAKVVVDKKRELTKAEGLRDLLKKRNKGGETALYRAVAYGKTDMLRYLAKLQLEEDPSSMHIHFRRLDGTPILHMAVLTQYFETALALLEIYNKNADLASMVDESGFTAFHLLANIPNAFKSGAHMGMMNLLYRIPEDLSIEREEVVREDVETGSSSSAAKEKIQGYFPPNYSICMDIVNGMTQKLPQVVRRIEKRVWTLLCQGFTPIEELRKEKRKHKLALELVKKLVPEDKSWLESHNRGDPGTITVYTGSKPEDHPTQSNFLPKNSPVESTPNSSTDDSESNSYPSPNFPPGNITKKRYREKDAVSALNGSFDAETPLLRAARNGIVEIVDEILNEFPQAVEHVNAKGKNILHVVAESRQKKTFELLLRRPTVPLERLHRRIDNEGNSILHNATKLGSFQGSDRPGEALHMQSEIQWYKQMADVVPPHFINHLNKDGYKAEELFTRQHEELVKKGGKWLLRTANSCSLVAALIATVAFTSAYTVPGGPDQDTGHPLLLKQNAFIIFTVSDTLSLSFALTSVVVFLSVMTARFHEQDFHTYLPIMLVIGLTTLFMAVSAMMVAFSATLVLMFKQKLHQAAIPVYLLACFPVTFFLVLQFPLYVRVAWYTLGDIWNMLIRSFRPRVQRSPALKAQ